MNKQTFGQSLKQHRERAGLTHEALGKMTRIDPGRIYGYEAGLMNPTFINRVRLERVLPGSDLASDQWKRFIRTDCMGSGYWTG
ncbi:MAG: helix-turn-helix transcriptional regulator [Magnetococcales bacterium]|nr:helix-turn-helix transcriptional regulator [Magnetococcales bacterium]